MWHIAMPGAGATHSINGVRGLTINRLELASVDRDAVALQRADPTAQLPELRTGLADGSAVIAPEIRNRLVIRRQPPEQPHHLDIAPRLALQPAAGRDPVQIAIDE